MSVENIVGSLMSIAIFIFGLFTRNFFPSYMDKKAENLATKEDIAEITDKIESVKLDYANQLETTKAELSSRINNNSFRYQKEYEILAYMTTLIVKVRDSAVNLRPVGESKDSNLPEGETKRQKLSELSDSISFLYQFREEKRPFYPDNIFQSLSELQKIASFEGFSFKLKSTRYQDIEQYWEEAKSNQDKIVLTAEKALEKIRDRVLEWDTLK